MEVDSELKSEPSSCRALTELLLAKMAAMKNVYCRTLHATHQHIFLNFFFSFSRWIEKVNLKVRATCAYPPELRGRKVKDVHVFRACPGGEGLPPAPTATPKPAKAPKATKPKPMHLNGHQHVKMLKSKSKPRKSSNPKPLMTKKSTKRHSAA